MISRNITILNRLGLHARAASKLVQCASSHQSRISITKNDKTINGKSIMGVLMLAASQGSEILVVADGADEALAVERICALVSDKFGESD